jgi:putative ABC transport system substrate-binding protein
MRRREFITLLGGATAWPLAVRAQQAGKVWRIGFLGLASPSSWASQVEALRTGLRALGYVEGHNTVVEFRWAEEKYDRLPTLAAELVRLEVDVLVTHSTPGTLAAKRATTTIPIVMVHSGDAVAAGLVASLSRPGGNITGSVFFNPEICAKRLELLKEAFPLTNQVAVLLNPDNPINRPALEAMEITARSIKVELRKLEARGPNEFESAFSTIAQRRVDAVTINEDSMLIANVGAVAELAARMRLPSAGFDRFAEAGGLIEYGVNFLQMYRRAAVFVDKILKGAKPADIPIEGATKFEVVINMKTAKALGVTFPTPILLRADRVIE